MNLNIGRTLYELGAFIKSADPAAHPDQRIGNKIDQLLSLLALDIPLMLLLASLIGGLEHIGLFNSEDHKFKEMMALFPKWKIALLGIIIIPLLEEMVFRLWLKVNRHHLFLFLFISSISLSGLLAHWGGADSQSSLLLMGGTLLLLVVVYFTTVSRIGPYLEKIGLQSFSTLYFLSALLFGFAHISNYTLTKEVLMLSPIIVLPQFIMGLFLGYLRVRFGWWWGYLMHALHNALFISIPLWME